MVKSLFGRSLAAGTVAVAAGRASATWSILLVDTRTGEIAVASATCLTNFDLRANTPVLIPGVGGATAQSFVDNTGQNRTLIRDLLATGTSTSDILAQLATFDTGHQTRQYGMIRAVGDPLTFSGTGAGQWAGGVTGVLIGAGEGGGDLHYAIQGNVLSGPSVVPGALSAIQNTTGDLAEKLMAGMEAARDLGGDGRCSCSAGNPTGCGDPPPSFTKSSHIAYMLVARDGDTEGCAPTYRLQARSANVLAAPSNAGTTIAAFVPENSASVEVREIVGDVAPGRFAGGASVVFPSIVRKGFFADVTADGLADLVLVASNGSGVWMAESLDGSLAFAPPVRIDSNALPVDAVAADIDGDTLADLAVADGLTLDVRVYWGDVNAPFAAFATLGPMQGPSALAIDDLNGSGGPEVAVLSGSFGTVDIFTLTGARQLTLAESIPTGRSTDSRIGVIDSANDGRADLLLGGSTTSVRQIVRKAGAPPISQDYALAFTPGSLDVGDVTGDGIEDAVVTSGNTSTVLTGFPSVPDLLIPNVLQLFGTPREAEIADFDLDGDLDLVYYANSWTSARLVENRGTGFAPATGCGSGEYFLNLNVAFSAANDPDPVFTLRDGFDLWRAERIGVTDAVRSSAAFDAPAIAPATTCDRTLTVTLRDWAGGPVTGIPAVDVVVSHDASSSISSEIGETVDLGGGVYRVVLSGTPVMGTDVLRIEVRDPNADAPIVLMPRATIPIRFLADMNGDGQKTPADFSQWVSRYQAGDPLADQNLDGEVTPADFSAWVANYNGPC